MEYEVHIDLKNGMSYKFRVIANSKDEIIEEITNDSSKKSYLFVTDDYIQYEVLKNEIVCIGISLNRDEAFEFENKFS